MPPVILGMSRYRLRALDCLLSVALLAASGLSPSLELAARVLVAGYPVGIAPAPPSATTGWRCTTR
jgi:hypothetical protein